MHVKVKLGPGAVLPEYATTGASGCDAHATEEVTILPGGTALVSTGLAFKIPVGYECQVRPRSGLAIKHGITVLNSPGTIDCDYVGEVRVILHNVSHERFKVKMGDRIAQLVFAPVVQAGFDVVDELDDTERGSKGFGSTGV